MDSFLGTLVFLLPGLMLYFWLQAFGINPVVKHNPAEFTAISVLLWLPVSLTTILALNLVIKASSFISNLNPIWTTSELADVSGSFAFLVVFLGSSLIISFVFGVIWAKWIHQQILIRTINKVREFRGVAPLSKTPSVWDEVFLNNDAQIVEITKIDKDEKKESFIGEIEKTSRTFEPERNLVLRYVDHWTNIISKYTVEIDNIFIDTKSGIIIKVYNSKQAKEAETLYNNPTS